MTQTQIINFVEKLTGQLESLELTELVIKLKNNCDIDEKEGLNLYEFFNMKDNDFKPHFDIEKLLPFENKEEFKSEEFENIIFKCFNELFDTNNEDWAYSEDNRIYKKDNITKFKISYHFALINKKTNLETIRSYCPIINDVLKPFDVKIDTSIYRNGMTKFRLPYTQKDNDKWSLLKPKNYTDNNELKNHIVQIIDGITDDLIIESKKLTRLKTKIKMSKTPKQILNGYKVLSSKKLDNNMISHTIEMEICPFYEKKHTNNHQQILEVRGNLFLKCFSERCKNKLKCIFKTGFNSNKNFDKYEFNSLEIPKGKTTNYFEKRKYFEMFYKYFRDNDIFCRVEYNFNCKMKYYERDLVEVKRTGLSDLKYSYLDEDKEGNIIEKKDVFMKKYLNDDDTRAELFKIEFKPDSTQDNKCYNLFDGFNYLNVLDEGQEITLKDRNDLKFLVKFIKNNVCDGNKKTFDYFISHFANIIKDPTFLSHMVFILYSNKGGTGKSNFLKFISKVIGDKYSYFGSLEQILQSHTTAHIGRLINIIEEIDTFKLTKYYEDIKNYSQRERGLYNPKGQKEYEVDTYVRYFGTTNNLLKIPRKDRRMTVFEFQKLENDEDIKRIDEIYENKKVYYLFGEYLKNYQVSITSRNEWEKFKPLTPAYKKFLFSNSIDLFFRNVYLLKENLKCNHTFLKTCLIKKDITTLRIKKNKLFELYKTHCDNMGIKPKQKQNFYKDIENDYKLIEEKKIKGYDNYKFSLEKLNEMMEIEEKFINRINLTEEELKLLDNDEDDNTILEEEDLEDYEELEEEDE